MASASAAAAPVCGQPAQQMPELRYRLLRGTQRQDGHAEIARPRQHAAEPRPARVQEVPPHALASNVEDNLQLAVGDGHAARRRQLALQGVMHEQGHDIVVARQGASGAARCPIGTVEIADDED